MDLIDTPEFADVRLLGRMLRLVDFLARPDAVKANTSALLDAAMKAEAATEENRQSTADLDAKKQAALRALSEAHQVHDNKLRDDRREFEDQTSSREAALRKREATVTASEKKLATSQQQVDDLRVDLQRRINALNAAADPRPFPSAVARQ
jgi:septal ring factor EnvC (AmiA/AmiB activator)